MGHCVNLTSSFLNLRLNRDAVKSNVLMETSFGTQLRNFPLRSTPQFIFKATPTNADNIEANRSSTTWTFSFFLEMHVYMIHLCTIRVARAL